MFDAKKLLEAMTSAQQAAPAPGQQQGGLGGLLDNVLGQLGQVGGGQAGAAGGLGALIGSVFGQATQGLQGLSEKTGVSAAAEAAVGRATGGQTPADLLAKAKEMVNQNQLASGAVLGSLGTLFLGTKTGRGLAVDTAKIGGLALIGGLAYQAWQNYQQGKSGSASPAPTAIEAAPAESPFGLTHDAQRDNALATLLIRAMIAAASADGVVDETERATILGNLQQLGLSGDAAHFLRAQFAHPASPEELASAVTSPEDAAQVYAAARLAIDPDEPTEQAFLAELARRLRLDPKLVESIDEAAESAKVQRAG